MTDNKKMTSLMLGAGVLATAALATQPTNKAEAATTRKVAYTEGATTVWTSPTVGQQVKHYLLPHQSVSFVNSQQVYGDKWLQTTDGGWVAERYLSPVASNTTTTTKTNQSAAKPVKGTLTANYDQGATTVWQGVNFLNVKGYLASGNQASYVATQQANGHTWYQLANGGWVLDSFVSTGRSAKPAAKATTPAANTNTTTSANTKTHTQTSTPAARPAQTQTNTDKSTSTTNQNTTATQDSTASQTTQTRPSTNTTTQNTTPTPKPAAPKPTTPKPSTPAAKPAVGTLTVTYTGGSTTVWQNESFSQIKGYLSANQKVSYTAKKQVNGATVYQLTNGGWVNGQYVTTGSHNVNTNQSSQPSRPSNTNNTSTNNHTTNTTVNKPTTPRPSRPATSSGIGVAIANQAKKYLGVPYVWGGTSPAGFDCSGLIYYAAQQVGYNIGVRTSQAMSNLGQYVSIDNIQPGDLLFWGGVGTAHHVAIYLGNNQFVQAPTVGDHVRITDMNYYRPNFARRL